MIPFDFQPTTRIVFGENKLDELGNFARELGAQRVLVVSDPGIVSSGHTQHGIDAIRAAGLESVLFDGVQENPTTEHVAAGLVVAQECQPDLIIGLGGGSSMDCAKGINFLYSCGGQMQDYWGVGKATRDLLPMIAVPTTAGTGSETQSFALISDAETHIKMACGDKRAAFRIALLDPKLTVTMPGRITALTGIDAIAHALETYVTKKRNPASIAFSREAWRLLSTNFSRVLEDPNDLPARGAMQLGACFAGLAIENSMLGATHALANPLTATYGIVHGQAVGLMLPAVIRFNSLHVESLYVELLEATAHSANMPQPDSGAGGLAEFISLLVEKAGLATRLERLNVDRSHFSRLAIEAKKQWTGTFNPRELEESHFESLYEQSY